MKLRDRTRRVLGNIKQEDCKPVLTTADSSTVTVPDTNTIDLTIKQEDTKEDKTLLKQDGGFNEKDYYYRCDICDMKMANLKLVLEHRASIHINKRYSKPKIKNIDTEPDVHDSDLYCKSCERRYIDRKKYRHHLRQVHYMVLKPLPIWKAPRSDVFPDPDDPKLHCRACDRSYKHKQIYNAHCRYAHGMKSIKLAKQSSESSSTTDTYCQTCDRRLSSMCSYRLHLFAVHKVNWKTIQRKREDMPLPNVNDPNYYCRSCEKKMTSKSNFNCHLMLVHSIFQTAPRKKSRLNPDVNDPNNYCRVCRKTYPSRGRYRVHLCTVHQIKLPALKSITNHTELPDPYNRDFYCCVCKKTCALLRDYRRHCRDVHFMTLSHASIVNPNAKININHPNFYCAQCEHSFAGKFKFTQHLRRVHHSV